ncbi:MAG: hypothetical protein MJK15_00595 [Colwellia sp.]|nr:hypothetical protein [Colwellia sp.]
MSTKRYDFSGPIADGDLISPDMSYTHERGYVALSFYSDAALTNLVTPSAGTVVTAVSENGDIYGSVAEATTNAADVGPAVTYLRPNWSGSARSLKLTLAGIVGANFVRCVISRFGAH